MEIVSTTWDGPTLKCTEVDSNTVAVLDSDFLGKEQRALNCEFASATTKSDHLYHDLHWKKWIYHDSSHLTHYVCRSVTGRANLIKFSSAITGVLAERGKHTKGDAKQDHPKPGQQSFCHPLLLQQSKRFSMMNEGKALMNREAQFFASTSDFLTTRVLRFWMNTQEFIE
ncbi:hypothetical protein P7K49_031470 [Saguinus oedipus]|uniref:Uncharacterized protein n=1 Tax=Saguinus oedipus TaxID=9490 RepID=A0ABQ9TZI2_SAGOE|nr:hypothetical protein P7K49_031470 [Saguinus oedipus]